ncbi:MAG: hypothetical protein RAO94_01305 [Candidatus Stygibacter australis]|nr:hypothetical protein [Candidatus Stygibacter australis]
MIFLVADDLNPATNDDIDLGQRYAIPDLLCGDGDGGGGGGGDGGTDARPCVSTILLSILFSMRRIPCK